MPLLPRKILVAIVLIWLLIPQTGKADSPYEITTKARVVAFADVHGAFNELVQLLKEVRIINNSLDWIGGDAHLVSLGDLLDRGPDSRRVMDLIMKLQSQARHSGGAVHLVLGNHEVMALTGDRRYVSDAEYAAFAGDETRDDREGPWQSYLAVRQDQDPDTLRETFDRQFPAGFFAMDKAFAVDGSYGRWLLQQPFIIKINDTVFMHGGISSAITAKSIEKLNRESSQTLGKYLQIVDRLQNKGILPSYLGYFDRIPFLNARAKSVLETKPKIRPDWFDDLLALVEVQKELLFTDAGPTWYRGTAVCNPYSESFNTERFLKRVGATRVVIGHTPNPGGVVMERMGGMVIRLDAGMLKSVYRGHAAALILSNGNVFVHYAGEDGTFSPQHVQRGLSMVYARMPDADLEKFLETAEVTGNEEIGTGITEPIRLTLQQGNKSLYAVYKNFDSDPGLERKSGYISRVINNADRYQYDVAAYRLDRLLDLQLVPVSVMRKINNREGVVTDWLNDSINERDRLKNEINFEGYCNQWEQYRLRYIFDVLIFNGDRNLTNILWSKKDFMMRLTEHSRAFRVKKTRPKQYRRVDLEVSDLLRERLQDLNENNLERELGPYLNSRQIKAILARRDLILKQAKSTDP